MPRLTRPRRSRASIALALCALAVFPATAAAFSIEPHKGSDVTNGIATIPGRVELDVQAGVQTVRTVGFQNRYGRPVDFVFDVIDIKGGSRGDQFLQLTKDAPFGAAKWISLDRERVRLQHGDIAQVTVTINVPADATPGSYYAAVTGTSVGIGAIDKGAAAGAVVETSVATQLFFNVPGEIAYGGRIVEVDAPRLFMRERGSYLAGSFDYENTGNITDIIGGTVELESFLGNSVASLPLKSSVVLRGGKREFRFIWTDTPWIGRFTPKIHTKGRGADPVVKQLDPIWIIPDWKYWVALALSLALPIWWRIRERRRERALLEGWDDDDLDDVDDDDFDLEP